MLIAALYAVCLVTASLTVPSMTDFLTYGLPTWAGGYLFAVLVHRAIDTRNGRRAR